jgi:hypothetical protein
VKVPPLGTKPSKDGGVGSKEDFSRELLIDSQTVRPALALTAIVVVASIRTVVLRSISGSRDRRRSRTARPMTDPRQLWHRRIALAASG